MENQNIDAENIKAVFRQPPLPRAVPVPLKPIKTEDMIKPRISVSVSGISGSSEVSTTRPSVQTTPASKTNQGWKLVDFGKNPIAKSDDVFRKDFRFKTEQALKGTLKHAADRSQVANLLWDKRGHGITKDEVKFGLRKLEKSGKLKSDQVRAVRRKLGVF